VLRQRIITALVLLAIVLPALFAGQPLAVRALTLVMIGAAGWEWGRLNGQHGPCGGADGPRAGRGLCGALAAGWSGRARRAQCGGGVAGVGGGRTGCAARRAGGLAATAASLRAWAGLVLLWAGWLALVQARAIGINFILSVLCLVWMADVAAYFGGRAFGRRKLAPSISPGKSWEGVWSGQAGVLLLAVTWAAVDSRRWCGQPSLFSALFTRWAPWPARWPCWRWRA
jgi:phosphatidate cytidylyltransferase